MYQEIKNRIPSTYGIYQLKILDWIFTRVRNAMLAITYTTKTPISNSYLIRLALSFVCTLSKWLMLFSKNILHQVPNHKCTPLTHFLVSWKRELLFL